MTANHWTCCNE